jgi:hypothetical protein
MFATGVFIGAAISYVVLVWFYEFHLPKQRYKVRKARRAKKAVYVSRESAESYFNNATDPKDIDLAIAMLITAEATEKYKKDQLTAATVSR